MITDARSLRDGTTLEADVCIVGAGPAGMTIARELSRHGMDVCLLESGGLEVEPDLGALSEAETTGLPYDLAATRVRRFGGASHAWLCKSELGAEGLRLRRLDPHDLEAHDWVPWSGWPFGIEELRPFYDRAEIAFELDPREQMPGEGEDVFGDEVFEQKLYRFGRSELFTQAYRIEIGLDRNISAFLWATVTGIETDRLRERVTRVRVATPGGATFAVVATTYVLAAGGIENPRLLLASRGRDGRGLGNEHDLVGRFFMEHPGGRIGLVVPADERAFDRLSVHLIDRPTMTRRLVIRAPVLARERSLQCALGLNPVTSDAELRSLTYRRPASSAVQSAQVLHRAIRHRRWLDGVGKHLGNALTGVDEIALAATARVRWKARERLGTVSGSWRGRRSPEVFLSVEVMTEQSPNPNSRVTLARARDPFGIPRARLHWELTPLEVRTAVRAQRHLLERVERLGFGKGYPGPELEAKPNPRLGAFHHHMGTTRMHLDPRHGVVDQDCRVHGVENLFISGSSLFPTGGYANPTLTLVALALRLADHIRDQVAGLQVRARIGEALPASE